MALPRSTLKDVADAAGVAESTASRVFTGHAGIAPETRARVMAAAEQLDYAPRRRTETFETSASRKGVVGVVVAALQNSFYPYLIERIHDELDALGYDMILIIDELSNSSSSRKIQTLIDTALDGVIFTTASIGSPAVNLLIDRGIPTVLAIRSNKAGNVPVIETDNLMAGAEAARHLVSLGHRHFGYILGPQNASTAVDRFTGSMEVLAAAGIAVNPDSIIWSDFTHQAGYSGMVQLLKRLAPPSAIICGNDVVAIGALDACLKLGVPVPAQISIIGFDDVPMASWAMIGLTTVRQSISEIGTLAARRIAERIETSRDMPLSHDILPTSIVRRGTTGPYQADPDRAG